MAPPDTSVEIAAAYRERFPQMVKVISDALPCAADAALALVRGEYVYCCLLPGDSVDPNEFYFANAMTLIKKPVEVVDTARIKIVTDTMGYGMYMARTPIPYPKASANFEYKKFVGIQCATKSALLFCGETARGSIESIEDIDEYRFLENGKKIKFIMVEAETLSVDTPKDLEKVRQIIRERGEDA